MSKLRTLISEIEFENPFILASAPPTALVESIDKAFEMGWAGVVIKTITPDNVEMFETSPRYQTIKSNGRVIGFQNIELLSHKSVQYWCEGISYLKKKYPKKVIIASIMAPVKIDEWQKLVQTLNNTPIDAYELNFSCPHGMPEKGIGMAIGTNAEISSTITSWVKAVANKPVFVKLTPNVSDITVIAKETEKAGCDGFSAINTVQGFLGFNIDTLEPNLNIDGYSTYGGISGEIIKPIGFKCVAQLRQCSNLPILGMGGISNWQDALQYILLGSDAVQVCTEVMLNGFAVIKNLKSGLLNYLEQKSINNISELKNIAISKITSHEKLNKKYRAYPNIDKEKCIKCGKCVTICEESEYSALKRTENYIEVDRNICSNCSLCSLVCPKHAIKMGL